VSTTDLAPTQTAHKKFSVQLIYVLIQKKEKEKRKSNKLVL